MTSSNHRPDALDLLVHMPCAAGQTPALRAALFIAGRLPARVDALCVAQMPATAFSVPEAVTFQLEEAGERRREAERVAPWFDDLLHRHDVEGRWHVAQGDEVQGVCHCAAGYDMLVLQRGPHHGDAPIGFGTVSRCVFGSHVPALVVPETPRTTETGRHVVLAWNGSRESVLAARGALPLLRQAESIHVLEGAPDDGWDPTSPPRLDLTEWLERRGVTAEVQPFHPEGASGPALLDACHQLGADLLVMGAWGRSRISEMVLGGATRHLFMHGDIPMLVAH